MTEVSISTPHHRLKGYVAMPRGDGPWPGVIVLHDIFGLTDVTRMPIGWPRKVTLRWRRTYSPGAARSVVFVP
jgi:Dienelactone hydrolase family